MYYIKCFSYINGTCENGACERAPWVCAKGLRTRTVYTTGPVTLRPGLALPVSSEVVGTSEVIVTFELPKAGGGSVTLTDLLGKNKFVVLYVSAQSSFCCCFASQSTYPQYLYN